MSSLPIADYALLSDCHSAALVSRTGSVDWLCFPRFDSPSVFGRLLDDDAGHWVLRPTGTTRSTRTYRDRTMVLETTFETPGGKVVVADALVVGKNERGHDLGKDSPGAMIRCARCLDGAVEMEMELALRPEYGLIFPLYAPTGTGVAVRGGASSLTLSSEVPIDAGGFAGRLRFVLREGQSANFALQYGAAWDAPPAHWDRAEIERRLEDTTLGWRSWSELHQAYVGPWRELVHQSGRVLQALTFQPTGAIVAAPTTSLPELEGGGRNWDYRYTWVRDASLTLDALWVAACPHEARHFFDFLARAAQTQLTRGADLQIVFGVGGERDLSERELSHLAGWRNSHPVRVGNGAWVQRQLDVYGELLAAALKLADQLSELDPTTRAFFVDAADVAASRWREKDHGIWEARDEPRDYLYSKLMCWTALDRAIGLAPLLEAGDRVERWRSEREEIRRVILERGWSDRSQAFRRAFGEDDLDASNLVMPMVGFLPADDPRVLATIRATAERLTDASGLVYRYRAADGLEGEEGTFLLCTFWLAEAQALAGDVDAAERTFSRAVAYANDVGLLAEEVCPRTGELLGNFPQAFSHIGLVNAAWAISQARPT
jgi:GH15 family glucan-1,4-alpha-glucosidase